MVTDMNLVLTSVTRREYILVGSAPVPCGRRSLHWAPDSSPENLWVSSRSVPIFLEDVDL